MNAGPAEERVAPPSRAWLPRWAPLLVALAMLAYHVAPLWARYDHTPGTGDGGFLWFLLNTDYAEIVEHHQLPLWNPYYCGGAPHLASPQSGSLSPFSILVVLFGTPIAHRLGYTLGLLAALLCLRAYARLLGLSELGATVAGAGYAMCGAFAQHMGGGHWVWIPFAFYPLMLRSFHFALAGRRDHIVWGALPLAFTIYHWPIYPMFYAMMLLPIYAVYVGCDHGFRGVQLGRRVGRAVLVALSMVGCAVALGALRLIPVIEHTAAHPRVVVDKDYTWPWELFEMYGLRHTQRVFGHQYVWPEFGNYLGLVGLALMLAGAVVVARRRRHLLTIVAGVATFVVFQLGNLVPLPWWLLRHLPVFNHLRVPSRFTIVAGMFMCVLIGVAVDAATVPALAPGASRRTRVGAGLVALLAVVFLVDTSQFNRQQWEQTFAGPPRSLPRSAEFHNAPGNAGLMYLYPPANQGSISCFEETPIPISPALRGNLAADEYLSEPAAGTVRRVHWSPNRIELEVELTRPATVVVNQNANPGWRVEGGAIVEHAGLLAASVPAGRHAVTFRYLPRSVLVGGAVTALAALGAAALVLHGRRRGRRRVDGGEPPRASA